MGTIKGCIFDLDGVIVNTTRYHYLAWKKLANALGFDFSEKDNESLKGVSRMESLEILLKAGGLSFDDETKLALAAKKNQWYVDYINAMEEDEVLPGAKEFIERLKAAGLKIALGSASKNALTILNRLRLADYFDVIIDGTKISRAKPDPEIFLLAAQELELPPTDCVVFEDAKAGVEAAKKAGMKCVGVGISSELYEVDAVIPGFENIDLSIL
ncbi:MAG TPA: beta-phosphoglucomutase [Bacillota bacterium]|nr:beta-phosphoglucomutase [Bacillota bacterium]